LPTSEANTIPSIIHEACRLRPKSVLDAGAGRGKYGCLLREFLDGNQAGTSPDDWTITIDAIEGFAKYVNDLHYAVYNNVWIEDFAVNVDKYTGYDLVLMIDSLEHLTREVGLHVLATLLTNNKNVIVSVPWGIFYRDQEAVFGNEFERHRARWSPSDFVALGGTEIYRGVCVAYSIPGRA
jgi:hypothetical protein